MNTVGKQLYRKSKQKEEILIDDLRSSVGYTSFGITIDC